MTAALAGLVLEAWRDLDRAAADLSPEDAERRIGSASPISWTVAHCTHMVDSWLNVNFQAAEPHPFINGDVFRKGAAGDALDWQDVQLSVEEVRASARQYLESTAEEQLEQRLPYAGSIESLRESGFSPRYAMIRITAHHYFHIGEIVAARSSLGHDIGDYTGVMEGCL